MILMLRIPGPELPAVLDHIRVHHRHTDVRLQALEFAEDQGPVRPGAGHGYVQVITAACRRKTTLTRWSGGAVCGDPVTEAGGFTLELAAGFVGVVPLVVPFAVY